MSIQNIVWITGASSGIGRAVAVELAKQGHRLIVSGRDRAILEGLAEPLGAFALPFDVTDRQATLDAAAEIAQRFGRVDLAFFNAGGCEYVDVKHFDSRVFEAMIAVNYLSLVYGVEAVLPLLRQSKRPHLVGMSSSVAYLGLPRSEAYGASKAASRNFLQGLRVSLLPEGILVSIVLPGFVKTPLTDKNDFPMPQLVTAEYAAQCIVQGIDRRRLDITVPRLFVAFLRFLSVLPASWSLALLSRLLRR